MSRIWIVSDKGSVGYPLDWLLNSRSDCELHTLSECNSSSSYSSAPGPEMLIVDLESFAPPTNQVFQALARQSPSPTVIAVYSDKYCIDGLQLEQFLADQFVVHAEDDRQKGQAAQRLAQQIDVFDRIADVHRKLRQQMNENRIIAKSRPMREILQMLPGIASTVSTVLLTGETGTGKELVARAIHYLGPRAGRPFIVVDCASIPEALIENELYGHARGAYTDAHTAARGLIQEADGGTLFLDEVETLPLVVQSKLLRFLQERQVKPLGESKYSPVDVRIIAATNGNLLDFVRRKHFREDLYYRLNVVPLYLPPLRDRKSDIPDLVQYFAQLHAHAVAAPVPHHLIEQWASYDWPGNVRELENKVQEWLAIPTGFANVLNGLGAATASIPTLAKVRQESLARSEQSYLNVLLSSTKGNISAAARAACVDRKSLRGLLRKYGLNPNEFRS